MLATSTAKRAFLARSVGSTAAARSLSVLSAPPGGSFPPAQSHRQSQHQLQQQRTLLGFVHAIDKRVYQWAKRQMPPISKTEQIALGCGTIGAFLFLFCCCRWHGCDGMQNYARHNNMHLEWDVSTAPGIWHAIACLVNVYPPFNACCVMG